MTIPRMGARALAILLVFGVTLNSNSLSQPGSQQVRAAQAQGASAVQRSVDITIGKQPRAPHEPLVSDGVIQTVLDAAVDANLASAPRVQTRSSIGGSGGAGARVHTLGCQNVFIGLPKNIKVNQDCSFRRQAEEQIVIDPTNSDHLLAGQNDSRIGFNHCGIDVSFDRGKTWGDLLPPLWGYLLRDNRTADAGSDPALAFDSQGNAYFTCILFNVLAAANAIVVAKSNAQFGGTFFHAPAPGPFQAFSVTSNASPPGSNGIVVSESATTTIVHDKEFLFADTSNSSPRRDRVYVTWTRFREECPHGTSHYCESPIFFSQSTDGGDHWSAPIEISGKNIKICTGANTFDGKLNPNKCNFDQGSWMVIAPDGALYVFFNNENVAQNAQQLVVKCPSDGRNCALAASWTDPARVALDVNTQPAGVAFGCTPGRQCLPPNSYRMNDFGAAGIDPNTGRLYFAWADYRTGQNHVYIVHSNDGGDTWSAPQAVTGSSQRAQGSAQWQPWMAVGPQGFVYVAYYDRQYGNCEQTGCNDITLAISHNNGSSFTHRRITTSSMPNLTLATNPVQAGFLGDYMSVAADSKGVVLVWADTRPHAGTIPEEDVYYASVGP